MKRIVLFRFHKEPAVCANNLKLLKKYNPLVPIYGVYGGDDDRYEVVARPLARFMVNIWRVRGKTSRWKWKHGDLVLKAWFEEVGRTVDFDMLHCVEWDLRIHDSLENIFGHVPPGSVGLTSLTPLREVEARWRWTSREEDRAEWGQMLEFVRERYNYREEPYACHFPGACLPKNFLAAYSGIEIPELCNDELRVPLFSQVLNWGMCDTRLNRKWFDEEEMAFFTCEKGREISPATISRELAQLSGRRVFHPFRKVQILDSRDVCAWFVWTLRKRGWACYQFLKQALSSR